MFVRTAAQAHRRERDGLVSRVLIQEGDLAESALTVTWVDVRPGASQAPHDHAPQQVYVIVRGEGCMRVGKDEHDVRQGDLVFVPSNVTHGITNTGADTLTYVSAATPAFQVTDLYDSGPLGGTPPG